MPSYLSVFVDELAKNVSMLFVLMHEANQIERKLCDSSLVSINVVWINMGFKTPFWHRLIYNKYILASSLDKIEDCDVLIVRSPTPLAPFFRKFYDFRKIVYLIVGDYTEVAKGLNTLELKYTFQFIFHKYYHFQFIKSLKGSHILVNSSKLYSQFEHLASSVNKIVTTTLTENDFYIRNDTCTGNNINILYTGRLDLDKGLLELIEAIYLLKKNGINVLCHIVGWEEKLEEPVKGKLLLLALKLGIHESVFFYGKKRVGFELNQFYRFSDIYVIPSYNEGFPRTIWEAFANSIPVIATRVGAIPFYLTDRENAILIEPKDVNSISSSILALINDSDLRMRIIKAGFELAKANTIKVQTKNMFSFINNVAHNKI